MSADPHLILSVDYELFGDGSGCLGACVLEPCERILEIAERHGFAVTLFVEALEFARMEEAPANSSEAELVGRVRRQITDAASRGHSAQLHLHPQWLAETSGADGQRRLDLGKWRLGDLPEEEIHDAVARGMSWLASVLEPAGLPRPIAFRAGAWCIQPFARVVPALIAHGIEIDSTVAPGLRNAARGDWYDFRDAESRPWWCIGADGRAVEDGESGASIIEAPVAVGRVSPTNNLVDTLRRKARREADLPPGCEGSYAGPNSRWQRLRGKLSKLASLGCSMLDMSTASTEFMAAVCGEWLWRHREESGALPIVGIGHTKNFTDRSAASLDGFLGWAREKNLRSSTYESWLAAMREGSPHELQR